MNKKFCKLIFLILRKLDTFIGLLRNLMDTLKRK